MFDNATAEVEGRYAFKMEWFDTQASIVRQYLLRYHQVDDTIEMFDVKNKRTFLKRCPYPSVKLSDLFIGAQINIYARKLNVLDYGDEWTRNKLSSKQARTLIVVKANAYKSIGSVIDQLYSKDLQVSKLRMLRMTGSEATSVFGAQSDVQGFTVGPVVAMEIVGQDVEAKLIAFNEAEQLVYISSPDQGAFQCQTLLENPKVATTAQFDNCTVCVIRPHALLAGHAGPIIDSILKAGFEISAMQMFNLDRQAVGEFLEVYKGVIAEYNAVAEELTTGSVIALEIRGQNVVDRFRDLAGPADPEVARLIRPNSLRAEFGEDKIKNAVHCTDLPEDGVLESEYFFSILQKSDAITFNRPPVVSSYTGFR
jgi:nucleoside-diphosphate kinase